MPRLIDSDAIQYTMLYKENFMTGTGKEAQGVWKSEIDKMPTVDAVPVIRCKDCKHWQCDDSESYCDELGIFGTDVNSYCSYAKRKEE